ATINITHRTTQLPTGNNSQVLKPPPPPPPPPHSHPHPHPHPHQSLQSSSFIKMQPSTFLFFILSLATASPLPTPTPTAPSFAAEPTALEYLLLPADHPFTPISSLLALHAANRTLPTLSLPPSHPTHTVSARPRLPTAAPNCNSTISNSTLSPAALTPDNLVHCQTSASSPPRDALLFLATLLQQQPGWCCTPGAPRCATIAQKRFWGAGAATDICAQTPGKTTCLRCRDVGAASAAIARECARDLETEGGLEGGQAGGFVRWVGVADVNVYSIGGKESAFEGSGS
ncbi:hypothetical protein EDC01DRAFT_763081, partial [Geopyxis carbonaria]